VFVLVGDCHVLENGRIFRWVRPLTSAYGVMLGRWEMGANSYAGMCW